jgi:8-oxo-dGTP pyrophosphatase MutT (NUDIX family)
MVVLGSKTASSLTIADIRARIRAHRYRPIAADERAIGYSVLVPVYQQDGTLHIVLTKRTDTVGRNKGHVSFPGGRRDPADPDLLATALRESEEEIGLKSAHVELFGRIDDFSTRDGNLFIAGFVGLIDPNASPYDWRPARAEVAEILEVPIAHFFDPVNVEVAAPRELNGRMWPNETFLFRDHRVFGATARALRNLFDIVLSAPAPARPRSHHRLER